MFCMCFACGVHVFAYVCICFAICSNGRKNCVYLGEEVWNDRDGRAMNEE